MAKNDEVVMVRIHDLTTNEVIDRPATEEEIAQIKKDGEEAKIKADNKADILARLGITEDEAKLILG